MLKQVILFLFPPRAAFLLLRQTMKCIALDILIPLAVLRISQNLREEMAEVTSIIMAESLNNISPRRPFAKIIPFLLARLAGRPNLLPLHLTQPLHRMLPPSPYWTASTKTGKIHAGAIWVPFGDIFSPLQRIKMALDSFSAFWRVGSRVTLPLSLWAF